MEFITVAISEYGLIAIFVLVLLEYACFPLPSEVVLTFSGAIAVQTGTSFLSILLLSIAAGMIGSVICYFLGYHGGRPLLDRLIHRFPRMKKGIEASEQKYHEYAAISVGIGRLIPLCRTYISFIAGIAKQNFTVYIISSSIGIAVWNLILVGLGYLFGENWNIILEYYEHYKTFAIPVIIAILLGVLYFKFFRKKVNNQYDR